MDNWLREQDGVSTLWISSFFSCIRFIICAYAFLFDIARSRLFDLIKLEDSDSPGTLPTLSVRFVNLPLEAIACGLEAVAYTWEAVACGAEAFAYGVEVVACGVEAFA